MAINLKKTLRNVGARTADLIGNVASNAQKVASPSTVNTVSSTLQQGARGVQNAAFGSNSVGAIKAVQPKPLPGSAAKTSAPALPLSGSAAKTTAPATSFQSSAAKVAEPQAPSYLTGVERQQYIENQAFGPLAPPPALTPPPSPPPSPTVTPSTFETQAATTPRPFDYSQYVPDQTVQDARAAYLASLTPTQEESDLLRQISELRESTGLGVSGLSGQGRGIPLNLVQGQQAKLSEQGAIKEQGLIDRLKILQDARGMQAQGLQTQLGFLQQDQERALAEAAKYQPGTPFEFDGNLVQYNPATGQVEVLMEGTPEAAKPITVSAGQTVIDPNTGQVLFQAAEKAEALPSSIQEYLFATQQGFTGSFQDYQSTGEANKPISAEASKLIANAQSGLNAIDTMLQTVDKNLGRGILGSLNNRGYRSAEANLVDVIGRLRSGGAITSDEDARFKNLLPRVADTDQLARQKLAELQTLLQSAMNGVQGTSGQQQVGGDSIDDFLNSFSSDLSMSQNGFGNLNNTQNLPPVQKTVSNLFGQGIITGYGSKLWKPGLDYVLPGGKNAQVKLPVQTTVVAVRPASATGGFGNQVKLRMPDGKEMWVSHLDKMLNVEPGTTLPPNTTFGTQGNTGNTYGKTGIHLDLTMPKPGGGYYTAEQVASYLNTIG